jgi:hypothetical protein
MYYKCPECDEYLAIKSYVHDLWCCTNTRCGAYQYGKTFTQKYCDMFLTGANDVKRVEVRALANGAVMEIKFQTLARRGWFKENIEPIVNIIKTQIPATQRSYDPVTYKWEIAMEFWMPIQVVLESLNFHIKHLADNDQVGGPTVPKDYADSFYNEPAPVTAISENIREKLFEMLAISSADKEDPQNLKALYRFYARKFHPDLGGDAAKMSELNRLWSLYHA